MSLRKIWFFGFSVFMVVVLVSLTGVAYALAGKGDQWASVAQALANQPIVAMVLDSWNVR